MSPALAVRRMRAEHGQYQPALVHRPTSPVVHVGNPSRPYRPLCGQRARRMAGPLRPELVEHKRLCGRCTRIVDTHAPTVVLDENTLAIELEQARTETQVVELRPAVIAAGARTVFEGTRLHTRYAAALIRVRKDQR